MYCTIWTILWDCLCHFARGYSLHERLFCGTVKCHQHNYNVIFEVTFRVYHLQNIHVEKEGGSCGRETLQKVGNYVLASSSDGQAFDKIRESSFLSKLLR